MPLYDSLTSRFIYPFRVYRLTTKFLGTFRGQWSNLVCGQQTGVVRMKSRCNKCICVVHLVTRARGGGGGKDREGGREERGRETWFSWHEALEQVLREIMQKAAFFTFYMGEHDHLQASLSRIGRASAQQRIGDEWMRDRKSQSTASIFTDR